MSQFKSAGDFAGWRYATGAEVTSFFTNGGFAPTLVASMGLTIASASSSLADLTSQLGRNLDIGTFDSSSNFTFRSAGLFVDQTSSQLKVRWAMLRTSGKLVGPPPRNIPPDYQTWSQVDLTTSYAPLTKVHRLATGSSVRRRFLNPPLLL